MGTPEVCGHLVKGEYLSFILLVFSMGLIAGTVLPKKKKKQVVDLTRFNPVYYSMTGEVLHVTISFDKGGHIVYLEDAKGRIHAGTAACSVPSLTEALDDLEVNINYLLEQGELYTKWGG